MCRCQGVLRFLLSPLGLILLALVVLLGAVTAHA
jgi:hypothetical protein